MGIFEAHFHDSEIKPSIHVGPKDFWTAEETGGEKAAETDEGTEDEFEFDDEGGPNVLGLVVLSLVFAVVATVVAKKLAGGDDGDEE